MGYSQWGHKSQTQFSDQTTNTHMCVCMYLSWRRKCTPLQYSCLENPTDGGAWWATVHGVSNSQTRLSDFTFTFYSHALEKEMATHSSVLAWRIPGTGSLVGCRLWGRTELERLKRLSSSSSSSSLN